MELPTLKANKSNQFMNSFLKTSCFALVASTILFSCKPQTPAEKPTTSVADTSSVANTGLKIAYIYGDTINEHYNFLIDAQAELEGEQSRIDAQMKAKLKKAQARAAELQKQAPTMTQEDMQRAQLELQNLDMDMQQQQEKLTADYRKRENELQMEYVSKIDSFLDVYNSDGRYDIILNYQKGGNLLWIKKGFDITDDVLKGLNDQYQAQLDQEDSKKEKK